MLKELIQKFRNTTDKSEMEKLSLQILKQIENLDYPNLEHKKNTLKLVAEPLETYIREYDSEVHRAYNSKNLDTILLLAQ